ncbi:TatD family hydrolase [Pelomonas sp. CA6]|uniref:TatD family hydrolase n=1 Tax=Pelomonas sp. CA6 TaxID=2907999 RepID=UPI001F4C24D7|nr:TatD family hydrolase [Pelomonas sp. CA6]MCH7345309.1 TatD family hydrolase [Pelomonas sp. CA6]
MFIDSHCHLSFPELRERLPELLEAMQAARVEQAICICTTMEEFPAVRELARAHAPLFATVGVHPDNEDVHEPSEDELVSAAAEPKVVAIGETGLDYYRLGERTLAQMEWQRERFRTHIRAARRAGKPLVVHTRSSSADTLRLLREEGADAVGGVMHCFTETLEVARAALDLGFSISFSGILTFKNAADLREVARALPVDRILIETDSPYLAPVPYRGKLNQPAYVPHVAAQLAELRGVTLETIARQCSDNTRRLFGLTP